MAGFRQGAATPLRTVRLSDVSGLHEAQDGSVRERRDSDEPGRQQQREAIAEAMRRWGW
jgi:hypothetical protein